MLATALKSTAVAALLGLGLAGAATTPAAADTLRTRCYGADCVRWRCNDMGFDCIRVGYYDRDPYDRDAPYARYYDYDSERYVAPPDYDDDYDYDPY